MTNLILELAARLQIEKLGETANDFTAYRANTVCIYGDWIEIKVPTPFACEEAARMALFQYITANSKAGK